VTGAKEAFLEHKRISGVSPATLESYEDRLAALLGEVGTRPVRYLLGRGADLYTAAQSGRRADTHRGVLVVGKMFGGWLVKHRWLRTDPFADVDPVGRVTIGADKQRLTIDQSRRLQAFCHQRAAEGDLGAVLTLGYLLLGPRASELVGCDVQHVDDGGRLLWVPGTKTEDARRGLLVPEELSIYLVALAADRPDGDPLFVSEASRRWPAGRRWTRYMAYNHVRRICVAAGVPELAPQALRRTQATLATAAGVSGLEVARHLGHAVPAAPAVTGRAYIGRGATQAAAVQRGMVVLQGGRR
jgi:integrase